MFSIYKPVLLMASIMGTLLIACRDYSASNEKVADVTLASTKQESPPAASNEFYNNAADSTSPVPAAGNEEQPKQPRTSAAAANVDWDKKIIKNASLTVEAKNHKSFNDFVHDQVKRTGGYVAEE